MMKRSMLHINPFMAVINSAALLFFGFIALALLTLVLVTPLSQFVSTTMHNPVFSTVLVSLETSITVLVLSFILGVPVAYVLSFKEFKGKAIIDTLVDLPLVMPPLVSGMIIVLLCSPGGLIGPFLKKINLSVMFTKKGIILAQFFVASPYFIKTVKESMQNIPGEVLAASSVLRATPFYTFVHVILPLCKKGIIAGLVMTWSRAMGEFGATAMVAGAIPKVTETMTVSIYMNAMSGDLNVAIVLSLFMVIFSFVLLYLFKKRFL